MAAVCRHARVFSGMTLLDCVVLIHRRSPYANAMPRCQHNFIVYA